MPEEWTNWSKSLECRPDSIEKPRHRAELQALVRRTADRSGTLRVVGQGHSSSPLVTTADTMVSLEHMTGVESVDQRAGEAWVRPGTSLEEMGEHLLEEDLAIHNQGDINVQQLAGAIGTGTHGTGPTLGNLSSMLLGVRMINAEGQLLERHIEDNPQFIRAARVALGSLGIFTCLRIKAQPAYRLHRQEWCTGVDECMHHLPELVQQNRNFDFYWYPRSDEVKLRTLNPPGESPRLPYAQLLKEEEDWAPRVLSRTRMLAFDEMEYSLPAAAGPAAFMEIRDRIRKVHRRDVAWRTLYRTVASDDAMLSTSYARPTVTISLHHNAGLPYWEFFRDIQPIFRRYDGRPHWGKKHDLRGDDLSELYPRWQDFQNIRREMDPRGLFMTNYLRELLGAKEFSPDQVGDTGLEAR